MANRTVENIEMIRKGLDNNSIALRTWRDNDAIIKSVKPTGGGMTTNGVATTTNVTIGPLLPVTWGQDCSYNDLCPSQSCAGICNTNAVTGCVATSMSQVIRYWQSNNGFGYGYASMPATFGNGEVQRLMHDAGLKVGMNYGCAASGGSSANGGSVPSALKNEFGFTSANHGGFNYNRVKNNVANRWPVLLEGCNNVHNILGITYSPYTCHEWVCDGYSETTYDCGDAPEPASIRPNDVVVNSVGCFSGTTLMFHMNWGWHELFSGNDFNGWFAFNNWTIVGAGPGNSNYNFQYAQDMTTEIYL